MKFIASCFLFAAALTAHSQISVDTYNPKVKCAWGEEDQIKAPNAISSCTGDLTITHRDMLASGGCTGVIIRTFVYEDACGNEARAELFITREDAVPPTFNNLPEDTSAAPSDLPDVPVVTASDNTGKPVEVTFEEKAAGPMVIRMWKATDGCGNVTQGMQRIALNKTR